MAPEVVWESGGFVDDWETVDVLRKVFVFGGCELYTYNNLFIDLFMYLFFLFQ